MSLKGEPNTTTNSVKLGEESVGNARFKHGLQSALVRIDA
jgi:hypothetical protein